MVYQELHLSGFPFIVYQELRLSGFPFIVYQVLRLSGLRLSCESEYLGIVMNKKNPKNPEISYILFLLSEY